ncbi:MAG: envelope stress response membrane protein PspB [Hellea sp.]
MNPGVLALLIPIIAIVMGIGSGMLRQHYKHKERMKNHMSVDQIAELGQMSKMANILEQRVSVLSRILDDEVPTWRENNDNTI